MTDKIIAALNNETSKDTSKKLSNANRKFSTSRSQRAENLMKLNYHQNKRNDQKIKNIIRGKKIKEAEQMEKSINELSKLLGLDSE